MCARQWCKSSANLSAYKCLCYFCSQEDSIITPVSKVKISIFNLPSVAALHTLAFAGPGCNSQRQLFSQISHYNFYQKLPTSSGQKVSVMCRLLRSREKNSGSRSNTDIWRSWETFSRLGGWGGSRGGGVKLLTSSGQKVSVMCRLLRSRERNSGSRSNTDIWRSWEIFSRLGGGCGFITTHLVRTQGVCDV